MHKILSRSANLNLYPHLLTEEELSPILAIGDLHGNALKLIYILIEESILKGVSEIDYQKLHNIYCNLYYKLDHKHHLYN